MHHLNKVYRTVKMSLCVGLIGSLFMGSVQAAVTQHTLANGFSIIIKEDHRAPVVVQQVWYRIGSTYEQSGTTGVSHMLEHLMFKSTPSLKTGEFSKKVAQMGGSENAFTSQDYTAYYQVIGKSHLESVMKLEADRMTNLIISDKEFQTERDVVAEERRWRTDDKPGRILYEHFKAMAFLNSPARHPVIGWMQDIQNWTSSNVRDWYHQWYAPNNATLVIVGDVDPKQVIAWAKKYYGVHKKSVLTVPKPQFEIEQLGERRFSMKGKTQVTNVLMGFHTPTLVTAKTAEDRKEVYALEMLSTILAGDDNARLPKKLVKEQKILAGVGVGYDATSRLKTLFTFQSTLAEGASTADAEEAIWKEIETLQSEPVTDQELKKVIVQMEAQFIYQLDSIQSQAELLGSFVSVGLPISTLDNWVKNLQQVSASDVQAVAKKYLKRDKVTVGILSPMKKMVQADQTVKAEEVKK